MLRAGLSPMPRQYASLWCLWTRTAAGGLSAHWCLVVTLRSTFAMVDLHSKVYDMQGLYCLVPAHLILCVSAGIM